MDSELRRLIGEAEERRTNVFFSGHELFVVAFKTKPVRLLGLPSLRKLDKAFADTVETIGQQWRTQVWRTDYFKDGLPVPFPFEHGGELQFFFWYLVLSLNEGPSTHHAELRADVSLRLSGMFRSHGLPCHILCAPREREAIEWHYAMQEMFSRLERPAAKEASKEPSSKRKSRKRELKDGRLLAMEGPMSVGDFLARFDENSQYLANEIQELPRYLRQETRDYKYLREEHIPIRAFIRRQQIAVDAQLQLGRETEPWDARIVTKDGTEIILEVVQALPREAHHYRAAVVSNVWRLPLEDRTRHQRGIDEFPEPIMSAIRDKHKMNYPEVRVLLVSVMGEYSDEDDFVINEWLQEVREAPDLGRGQFSSIYLVEMARGRLFKVF
ncbi:hypothetical protein [Paraburkholderia aspalathi]|uniref:Uncharacterized protein n=1 Tax=Paraburkholderia aspalathi TaxID=1324617 RepID=A0A1I7EAQ1_9BURK|nr:hypothetical protein [Paraburkholderia aspalathi]SFU21014.1 hypothetical protein SAMN05192563_1015166 [Paraburkholderia aspalathi]